MSAWCSLSSVCVIVRLFQTLLILLCCKLVCLFRIVQFMGSNSRFFGFPALRDRIDAPLSAAFAGANWFSVNLNTPSGRVEGVAGCGLGADITTSLNHLGYRVSTEEFVKVLVPIVEKTLSV